MTVPFLAHGHGTFRFSVSAPLGWSVLNDDFTQPVDGRAILLVTVRVARDARPGPDHAIAIAGFQDGTRLASARSNVVVERAAGVALRAPRSVESLPGQAHSFDVVVLNTGNYADRYEVDASGTVFGATAAPRAVAVAPGAGATVRLSVAPTGWTSNGFSQLIVVKVVSTSDGRAVAQARINDSYFNPAAVPAYGTRTSKSPQLVLGVGGTVEAGLDLGNHAPQANLEYAINPVLYGDLSDFVHGSLSTAPLKGGLDDPLPGLDSVRLAVSGDGWQTSADVGVHGPDLSAAFELGDWTLDGKAGYRWDSGGFGARARGAYATDDSDLSLVGQVQRTPFQGSTYGTDLLSVSYSRDLGSGFSGRATVSALGIQRAVTGYTVVPRFDEQLAWQDARFDVMQRYAAVPTLGSHSVSVTGGTRSLVPFGVRTTDTVRIAGDAYGLTTSLSAFGTLELLPGDTIGAPRSDLNLRLSGHLDVGTAAAAGTYAVNAGMGWTYLEPGEPATSVSASYAHTGGLEDARASDRYRLGVTVLYGNLATSAAGTYARSYSPGLGLQHSLNVDVSASYSVSLGTRFGVSYGYRDALEVAVGTNVVHDLGSLSWHQDWALGLSSDVRYGVDYYPHVDALSRHGVDLSLAYAPVTLPALHVGLKYGVEAPLGDWSADAFEHRLALRVGYELAVGFDTPPGVIQAFGGRKTGEVVGRAFVREADGSTRPLAGIELGLGDVSVTSGPDGTFAERVPVGSYRLELGAGVPATVGYFGRTNLTVERDQTVRLDLPFEPVGSLRVFLYDDANRNGRLDEGEAGIPYAGVKVDGPVQREAVASRDGVVRLAGLPAGTYTVAPDPGRLPTGYLSTHVAQNVVVAAGARDMPVAVGAALPAPTVVTTFQPGSLSLFVQAAPQNVPAGAEVTLTVQVTGAVESVRGTLEGNPIDFEERAGTWKATPRVPLATPPGPLPITVTAIAGATRRLQDVTVTVVKRVPFRAAHVMAVAGSSKTIEIDTLFKAQRVELELPGGATCPMQSTDGYHWQGTAPMPDEAGDVTARVIGDGEAIGTMDIAVTEPPKGGGD